MSPRIKDILDGNKHPVHHPEEQNVIAPESAAPNGNVFSSFPGPVKFPTLIDLEKCEKSYPEIHADIIQEVAVKTCSVPLEVPIELLKSRKENTQWGAARLLKIKRWFIFIAMGLLCVRIQSK
jgi:hypothetical protein